LFPTSAEQLKKSGPHLKPVALSWRISGQCALSPTEPVTYMLRQFNHRIQEFLEVPNPRKTQLLARREILIGASLSDVSEKAPICRREPEDGTVETMDIFDLMAAGRNC
jgi:hypothetical protein